MIDTNIIKIYNLVKKQLTGTRFIIDSNADYDEELNYKAPEVRIVNSGRNYGFRIYIADPTVQKKYRNDYYDTWLISIGENCREEDQYGVARYIPINLHDRSYQLDVDPIDWSDDESSYKQITYYIKNNLLDELEKLSNETKKLNETINESVVKLNLPFVPVTHYDYDTGEKTVRTTVNTED